jgi:methylmalonyl-CoA mutase N-terminal domain/subunit
MNEPGSYPYDAGLHPGGYTTRRWTVRQLAGLADGASTNERFRFLLEAGETGLSLAFDLPTQHGLDPDAPAAAGEVGAAGVSIATADDLAAVFDGIGLDRVSVSFTINATAPILLAMWVVAAEESGVDPAALRGTLQNEMLKEFLARKATVFGVDLSFRYSLDVIEYCLNRLPGVNPVSISGAHAREAGATRALEIACAVADAETYLAGMIGRGYSVDEVAPRFSFIFGSHMELLAEAAKFRTARALYATRMRERWGARDPRSHKMRIQVNTFGSALAYQEPLNNVARATVQAIAAVLGGAQSLHVCSFDEAHHLPGPLGARIALRTQQILAEETDLARYPDPLGGSLVVEELVREQTREAVAWLDRIEARGGMLACLRSGWLEDEIGEAALSAALPTVGVRRPVDSQEEARLLAAERTRPRPQHTRTVQRAPCADRLETLEQCAREGRNVVPALIEAARARATLGQLTEALRAGQLAGQVTAGRATAEQAPVEQATAEQPPKTLSAEGVRP